MTDVRNVRLTSGSGVVTECLTGAVDDDDDIAGAVATADDSEGDEALVWFWIGTHAEYDRLLRQL